MADGQPTSVVENWKPVVGYEGLYEVSDHGRVRSFARIVEARPATGPKARWKPRSMPQRVLRCAPNSAGYPTVGLYKKGTSTTYSVHRLVLEAFVGPCPRGAECCHGNGNRADDRLENLRWDTRKANFKDQRTHGTALIGERNKQAKLTWSKVRRIRQVYIPRHPRFGRVALAREYGVDVTVIDKVLSGETWPAAFDATFKDELERIQ